MSTRTIFGLMLIAFIAGFFVMHHATTVATPDIPTVTAPVDEHLKPPVDAPEPIISQQGNVLTRLPGPWPAADVLCPPDTGCYTYPQEPSQSSAWSDEGTAAENYASVLEMCRDMLRYSAPGSTCTIENPSPAGNPA